MQTQPSNAALQNALHRARVLTSHASLSALRKLRDQRTTWYASYELHLRAEIDLMLDGAPA